jgi:alkylated DNA repair protein (DNA oxidative demethylase)
VGLGQPTSRFSGASTTSLFETPGVSLPSGVRHIPGHLDRPEQEKLVGALREIVRAAPLYTPAMPRTGKEMSVRMTNCGTLGWVTDKERGYRYQATHPVTGERWPPIPEMLLTLWRELSDYPHPPEACLVNFYFEDARMGLHQDRDEADLNAPVVSISLGDACLFRVGQTTRSGSTQSLRLESGDVLVLGGAGRLCFHGVDRIYPGTSDLLPKGGRINLTLRRVTRPV